MKRLTNVFAILFAASLLLLPGCGGKPAAVKKGVLLKVIWTEGQSQTGLFREKLPSTGTGLGGEYGVDMYGILYPTHLEVQFRGNHEDRAQIIPLDQIRRLEFGSGGIRFDQ